MNQQNQLAEWLKIFDREGLGTPRTMQGNPAYVSQGATVPIRDDNAANRRMLWATGMMSNENLGQPSPNFFGAQGGGGPGGSGGPAYVQPEQFGGQNPFTPQVMQNQRRPFAQDPMRPQVQNFLSRLMGGQNAR